MGKTKKKTPQNQTEKKAGFLKWSTGIVFAGYILLTVLYYFLGYLENPDQRIKGFDSVYYYIYLPSTFFDGDLNFTNELTRLYPSGLKQLTDSGLPRNLFSVGPAVFWSPFFILAHILTLISRLFGGSLAADGFSSLYQLSVYVANSFYGLAGVLLTLSILRRYVAPLPALLSALGIMLASQLTYYFWSFTAMSHNISFASTSLFLLLLLTCGPGAWTALAAAAMILARWQNALFLLPLGFMFINQIHGSLKSGDRTFVPKEYLIFGVVLLAGLTPQFLAWKAIYGKFLLIPQGSGFIDFKDLAGVSVLFGLRHGLFSWHPLLLIGLAGIYFLWKREKTLALSLIGVFVLQWIVNESVSDWWAGWSFGNRRFINLLPIFALGLGLILNELKKSSHLTAALLLLLLSATWNQLFIYQYMKGLIPRGDAVTSRQMFGDKFHLPKLSLMKDHIVTARYYLQQKDIQRMKAHAAYAYKENPSRLNAHVVYGLACILSGDSNEGFKVFQSWHDLDSTDILAKYGLAEYLIKQGEREAASRLFSPSSCAPKDSQPCRKLAAKIKRREPTLLDGKFLRTYEKRVAELYGK